MGGGNVVVTETRMRVFLTSTEYTGSFGGVAGADQICALTAQAGNKGGTWKAWMSGTTENAIDRITDVGPWFQEKNDGTWVKTFNNNANLTTSLLSRLYVDEQGRGNSFDNTRFYWTGTLATGLHATTTCAGWTTSSASQSGLTGPGTSSWSNGSTDSCSASWAIVCFEQSKLPAPNTVSATKKRIFLTSTEFKGDFGGVTGADSLCNTAAQAATKGGQWTAWVSVTGMNAIDRISDVGPWYQEKNDSTLVLTFRNRANLVVSPLARLYVDEQGRGSAFDNTRYYWTGTQAGGAASSTTCTNWTSAGAGSSGLVGPGTSNWSAGSPDSCSASWALVCIEQ